MSEIPQLGREGPGQPVADMLPYVLVPTAEPQPVDAAVPVRLDPEPLPERRVGQPVGVVRPARAAGRVVERHQRCPVRLRAGVVVAQRHRGRGGRARGHTGGERAQPQNDRLAIVGHGVPERRDVKAPVGVVGPDGHGGRHPVVRGGRSAAGHGRHGYRHRPRRRGHVAHTHPNVDRPALERRVLRPLEGDRQRCHRLAANETGGPVVRDCGQPRLEGGGVRHAHAGALDAERLEARQAGQARGERPAQHVELEIQLPETGQVSELGGNRSGEGVALESHPLEAGEISQLGRYRSGQGIVIQMQPPEFGQAAQPRRDRPRQTIPPQGQPPHPGQIPPRGRDRPRQVVSPEVQTGPDWSGNPAIPGPARRSRKSPQSDSVCRLLKFRNSSGIVPVSLLPPRLSNLKVRQGTQPRRDRSPSARWHRDSATRADPGSPVRTGSDPVKPLPTCCCRAWSHSPRRSSVTRPSPSVPTPCQSPSGALLSQLVLSVQLGPPVAL